MEEHPLHHPMVEGSSTTHGTDREKLKKLDLVRDLIDCRIMVEEHPSHHPKAEGLHPTHGTDREKLEKLEPYHGGRTPISSSKG